MIIRVRAHVRSALTRLTGNLRSGPFELDHELRKQSGLQVVAHPTVNPLGLNGGIEAPRWVERSFKLL